MSYETAYIEANEVKCFFKNHVSEILDALQNCLASYSAKDDQVVQPVRTAVNVSQHNGLILTMPAFSKAEDAFTTKIVTIYPDNPEKFKLPVIQAQVLLFSAESGSLKAIVNGNSLTALRTAGASAIATKSLASPNSKILAILGSGIQARSHFEILSTLYEFEEIRIWNINPQSAQILVNEIIMKGLNGILYESAQNAVRGADIIVTATISRTPILKGTWLKKGAHVNAIGACDPSWRELDDDLMTNAKIYVDSREASVVESGDIILSKAEVFAEIGEVFLKTKSAMVSETTVFKSLGMAIEDTVSASLVYKHHHRQCKTCLGN